MKCTACHRKKEIRARGLCAPCYQRWLKRGTTDYAPKRVRAVCHITGCSKPAVAHNLCDTHRKRLERHGHLEETRPDSWGAIHKHPMRNAWNHLLRHSSQHPVCDEWRGDFLQFVSDVGGRPTPKHKLFVADASRPIGPDNFVWKRAITERVAGEDAATYAARRSRVYRAVRQEEFKGYDLKKLYGLSFENYEAMHALQRGKCAVCRKEEATVIRGKRVNLPVDHCHKTGAVRGLLCTKCNRGLGMFCDDPEILRRAITYLEAAKRVQEDR